MIASGRAFVLAAVALLPLAGASAQMPDPPPVTFPKLAAGAQNAKGFAPRGWIVEAEASGDLNGDQIADLVFVLHATDKKNVLANKDGLGVPELDTNPRILAVAFGTEAGGFTLAAQNHTLIPRRDSPTLDDPFAADGGLLLARGAFSVGLNLFSSAGGWETFTSRFTFRWQNGRFELIGFDRDSTMRNSGETVVTSVNYSTGRMQTVTGSIENDRKKTQTRTLPKKPLLTIEQVGNGLEFQPG